MPESKDNFFKSLFEAFVGSRQRSILQPNITLCVLVTLGLCFMAGTLWAIKGENYLSWGFFILAIIPILYFGIVNFYLVKCRPEMLLDAPAQLSLRKMEYDYGSKEAQLTEVQLKRLPVVESTLELGEQSAKKLGEGD
jgi:hypothetical protein